MNIGKSEENPRLGWDKSNSCFSSFRQHFGNISAPRHTATPPSASRFCASVHSLPPHLPFPPTAPPHPPRYSAASRHRLNSPCVLIQAPPPSPTSQFLHSHSPPSPQCGIQSQLVLQAAPWSHLHHHLHHHHRHHPHHLCKVPEVLLCPSIHISKWVRMNKL